MNDDLVSAIIQELERRGYKILLPPNKEAKN